MAALSDCSSDDNNVVANVSAEADNGVSKRRQEILTTLEKAQAEIQPPNRDASPMIAMIMFGELNTFAQNGGLFLREAMKFYNPIVKLRDFYKMNDWAEAAHFWDQVKYNIQSIFQFCFFPRLLCFPKSVWFI